MKKKTYYNVADDLAAYPDCWLYVAYSMRGPGKTYSFLRHCTQNNIPFLYLKRTQVDIDLIALPDFMPFKPINRDLGTGYTIVKMYDGISKFVAAEGQDEAIGYAMALSAIHKFKGFDLSEVQFMCLDEFMPQLSEKVNKKEGELLLDLYMTVNRDREERNIPPLKLILFANATQLYCPITDTLGLVDELSDMVGRKEEFRHLEDRGILLHHIPFSPSANEDTAIFKGMKGTAWADMAFGGEFAYNDFSRVKKLPLKNMVVQCKVIYQRKDWFIYSNQLTGLLYMCRSRAPTDEVYDLEIEADQRRFWQEWGIDLKNQVTDDNMFFSSYSSYNLIYNFNKIYRV